MGRSEYYSYVACIPKIKVGRQDKLRHEKHARNSSAYLRNTRARLVRALNIITGEQDERWIFWKATCHLRVHCEICGGGSCAFGKVIPSHRLVFHCSRRSFQSPKNSKSLLRPP